MPHRTTNWTMTHRTTNKHAKTKRATIQRSNPRRNAPQYAMRERATPQYTMRERAMPQYTCPNTQCANAQCPNGANGDSPGQRPGYERPTGGLEDAPQGKRKNPVKRLGNQTWLVGVKELMRQPPADEQRKIAQAAEKLELEEDELSWLRWQTDSKFAKECCAGDQLIQIWKRAGAKRLIVCPPVPVLLKQKSAKWTRFYVGEPSPRFSELSWGRFNQLLNDLDYPRKVGSGIVQLVKPDMSEAIVKAWKSTAKS